MTELVLTIKIIIVLPAPPMAVTKMFLRDEELTELQTELPTLWQNYIDRLSEYMASTGKQYQSHH